LFLCAGAAENAEGDDREHFDMSEILHSDLSL